MYTDVNINVNVNRPLDNIRLEPVRISKSTILPRVRGSINLK
jgi:hypothetical protein